MTRGAHLRIIVVCGMVCVESVDIMPEFNPRGSYMVAISAADGTDHKNSCQIGENEF